MTTALLLVGLAAFGVATGAAAGLLGVGGGIVIVPPSLSATAGRAAESVCAAAAATKTSEATPAARASARGAREDLIGFPLL